MSKKDKLLQRLQSKPTDMTMEEIDNIMTFCDCTKSNKGRTSGSRIAYTHNPTQLVLMIHAPHSPKELKGYQIKSILAFLESIDIL